MRVFTPYYQQKTDYTCGPASLEMVLAFLGDRKSEKLLAREAHTTETEGTRHAHMIDVARREGFYCYANSHSSIDEIKRFLMKRLPVIVNYTEPSTHEGHYAVVVGIQRQKIILNDPWNGKDFSMYIRSFLSSWYDSALQSDRWLMVISKDDFGLGRQYCPM